MKVKTNKRLKKILDELWSKAVKKRAGYKCEYKDCKNTSYLNSHHIYNRRHFSTRWLEDNGICLCVGHHTLRNDAAHKDPNFMDWLRTYRSKEELWKLETMRWQTVKYERDWIEGRIQYFKEIEEDKL